MAQIPQLTPTTTLDSGDETILRQGTTDKRISLELAGTLSWAKREGYTYLGGHVTGIVFSNTDSFTTYEGRVYFVNLGISLPYTSTQADPSADPNLYAKTTPDMQEVVSNQSLGGLTNYQANSIDDMIAGKTVGWKVGDSVITHTENYTWSVSITDENDDADDVAVYVVTTSPEYPRVDLGGGLYASRKSSGSSFIVNKHDWGLTSGVLTPNPATEEGIPKYTNEQYAIAKNNGDGISRAVQWCVNRNISNITFPSGTYPVCYTQDGSSFAFDYGAITIDGARGLTVTGNTELYVIYDSLNFSPYHTGGDYPFNLFGTPLLIKNTSSTDVKGLKIKGDKYERAYSETIDGIGFYPDRTNEHTHGIVVYKNCWDVSICGNEIHGFMGDCIAGDKWAYYVGSKSFNLGLDAPMGGLGDSGEDIPDDGRNLRRTPIFIPLRDTPSQPVIDSTVFIWGDYVNQASRKMRVCYYDESQQFIFAEENEDFNFFKIPSKAYFIRCQFEGIESVDPTVNLPYRLFTGFSRGIKVKGNDLYNTNRGGVSNLGHESLIEGNIFSDTGGGSAPFGEVDKYGQVTFNSNTRYCINLEDFHFNSLTVKENTFNNYYAGLLSFCKYTYTKNNTFNSGVTSSIVYYYPTKYTETCNNPRLIGISYPVYSRLYNATHHLVGNDITKTFNPPSNVNTKYFVSENNFYDNIVEIPNGMKFHNNNVLTTGVPVDSTVRLRPSSTLYDSKPTYSVKNNNLDTLGENGLFVYGSLGFDYASNREWGVNYSCGTLPYVGTHTHDWGENRTLNLNGLGFVESITEIRLSPPPYVGETDYNAARPCAYAVSNLKSDDQSSITIDITSTGDSRISNTTAFSLSNLNGAFKLDDNRQETTSEDAGVNMHVVLFDGCTIDVENIDYIFNNIYMQTSRRKRYTLRFNGCTFYSNGTSRKSFKLCNPVLASFLSGDSVADNCKFINCDNTDDATTEHNSIVI